MTARTPSWPQALEGNSQVRILLVYCYSWISSENHLLRRVIFCVIMAHLDCAPPLQQIPFQDLAIKIVLQNNIFQNCWSCAKKNSNASLKTFTTFRDLQSPTDFWTNDTVHPTDFTLHVLWNSKDVGVRVVGTRSHGWRLRPMKVRNMKETCIIYLKHMLTWDTHLVSGWIAKISPISNFSSKFPS